MKVSVIGLGRFGTPLAEALVLAGHEVKGSRRAMNAVLPGVEVFPLASPAVPAPELLKADILVLNIPPFPEELAWFQTWPFEEEPWVIFISSTSASSELLLQEEWIKGRFKSWTILRFAGLLGGERHPGKHLAGRKGIKGRRWPVNLLHHRDAVGFTLAIIEKEIKGELIEVVSSEHRLKEEFYTEYAKENGLPLPEFDPSDESVRPARDGSRAHELYQFTWP